MQCARLTAPSSPEDGAAFGPRRTERCVLATAHASALCARSQTRKHRGAGPPGAWCHLHAAPERRPASDGFTQGLAHPGSLPASPFCCRCARHPKAFHRSLCSPLERFGTASRYRCARRAPKQMQGARSPSLLPAGSCKRVWRGSDTGAAKTPAQACPHKFVSPQSHATPVRSC
jgi:hypothetical protein